MSRRQSTCQRHTRRPPTDVCILLRMECDDQHSGPHQLVLPLKRPSARSTAWRARAQRATAHCKQAGQPAVAQACTCAASQARFFSASEGLTMTVWPMSVCPPSVTACTTASCRTGSTLASQQPLALRRCHCTSIIDALCAAEVGADHGLAKQEGLCCPSCVHMVLCHLHNRCRLTREPISM